MRSDEDLVAAAISADRSAWDELVERHSQLVYANARAVGADAALAHDVSQMVWLRLLTRLETIREPGRLRGWLAIVARNTAREELRRRKPTSSLDALLGLVDDNAPSAEDLVEAEHDVAVMTQAMAVLSERCRDLLTMLFSAEMSYEEISEASGVPIGSIGPTRQRCLGRLRDEFVELDAK